MENPLIYAVVDMMMSTDMWDDSVKIDVEDALWRVHEDSLPDVHPDDISDLSAVRAMMTVLTMLGEGDPTVMDAVRRLSDIADRLSSRRTRRGADVL